MRAPSQIVLVLCAATVLELAAQTTQSSLFGAVQDSVDGHSLSAAQIECEHLATGVLRRAATDGHGEYFVLSLSPGTYRLRVTSPGYQPQEIQEFEIRTASSSRQPFALRPLSDVWEQREKRNLQALEGRAVLPLVGPDLGPGYNVSAASNPLGQENLLPAVSSVVGQRQLYELPLAGRDAYELLISLGGVNSDTGSGRGLGLTVSGQRPSSASFRLDGFDNNNALATGPGVALAPEAIAEYRVSQAHFSAEYGGTAGLLANAVSREAGTAWHGQLYSYIRNEALDANSFARNRTGTSRAASREWQPGLVVSGPLQHGRSGVSLFVEAVRGRGETEPQMLLLPSANYRSFTDARSLARRLLDAFPAPLPRTSQPWAVVEFRPDSRLRRVYGMGRADQRALAPNLRVFERLIVNRVDRPEFIWSPYPDFVSPLRQDNASVGLSAIWTPAARWSHEMRTGYSHHRLGWPRAYPQIPTLTAFNFAGVEPPVLPGSVAAYAYRDRNRGWEAGYNATLLHNRHEIKAGAEILTRRNDGALTFGRDGRYIFPDLFNFYLDWPTDFQIAVDRSAVSPRVPDYETHFGTRQIAWFLQDQWRVSPRLAMSGGIRYESFGAPELRGGTRLLTVEGAKVVPLAAGATAYSPDANNVAVRMGLSYRLAEHGPVLRASYGIFYDRPFDNLWQNLRANSIQVLSAPLSGFPIDYLRPVGDVLQTAGRTVRLDFPGLLLIQPGIRDPYAQNYFAGASSTFGDFWQWEANVMGSLGRKLITTDRVNRVGQIPGLGELAYRANQGIAGFNGMNAVLRRQSPDWLLAASYTWSHAIDNQSDPLAGDFLDLSFTSGGQADASRPFATFSRESDSHGDRGNSDFDQRHNLVVLGSWHPPAFARGWRIAWLGTVRSGLPFTVIAPGAGGSEVLYNRRADYVGGPQHTDVPVDGGIQYLNPAAFRSPSGGGQGNLGRNSLRAPAFYSADVSVARSIRLSESGRLTVRADMFNLLNHTNLDRPETVIGAADFGVSRFGRRGQRSSFPAAAPLDESARRIQLGLKLEF